MKQLPVLFLLVACLFPRPLAAAPNPLPENRLLPGFTLHKLESGGGPTLLVVGGIQGDEPGGFSAASLLVTHYRIKSGNVWVVPNLNFPSIITSARGTFGDMNRKFAHIAASDPDYEAVRHIQRIILEPQVDLVLNLHDGSGYYRSAWEGPLRNPKRWGQCIVIDQEQVDDEVVQNPRFKNLQTIARNVKNDVNVKLLRYLHAYRIKNTTTRNFDTEMEKTLSYFAVRAGKAAFGLEASKELPAAWRVYYHTCLLEAFMREMGIEFEREFHLSPSGVALALNQNVSVSLYNKRTVLKLENARAATGGFVPVHKDASLDTEPSNPLLAVLPGEKQWLVVYGNRTLTRFTPEYLDFDDSIKEVELLVDGRPLTAGIGDVVPVLESFAVKGRQGYRVNAIGAALGADEADMPLKAEYFASKFSLDRAGKIYRVEFYKDKAFCGMILVNFQPEQSQSPSAIPLTAGSRGEESSLGR
jgi:hypothetical protein